MLAPKHTPEHRHAWPTPESVASKLGPTVDPQADAWAFVKERCSFGREAMLEAFVAFQTFRTWEVDRMSEIQAFALHFGRGRRTLFKWKSASGFIDSDRSQAIRRGVAESAQSALRTDTELPERSTWRACGQMDLPFGVGFVDDLQRAGESLIDAAHRLGELSDAHRRAFRASCQSVRDLVERCLALAGDS